MRICISGPQCTGKSTLIKDFINQWPKYKTPTKTYRDVIVENNLEHSSKTSEDTQEKVLSWMIEDLKKYTKFDNVIFDRGPIDNLVYTLWANGKGSISDEYTRKAIQRVKESMRNIDLIVIVPVDPMIPMVDDNMRDTDLKYQSEINNIFKALINQYMNNYDADVYFPFNDSPGVIELYGTRQERINFLKENYLDDSGELYGDEHSILNPTEMGLIDDLMKSQEITLEEEKKIKATVEKEVKKIKKGIR